MGLEGLFVKGTWNCEFADEVQPQESDIILQNRVNFSAFRGTQLKNIIEEKGVKSLFVVGFLSNVCVTETTLEARELFPDLKIYVCSDGCAAKSKQVGLTISIFILCFHLFIFFLFTIARITTWLWATLCRSIQMLSPALMLKPYFECLVHPNAT